MHFFLRDNISDKVFPDMYMLKQIGIKFFSKIFSMEHYTLVFARQYLGSSVSWHADASKNWHKVLSKIFLMEFYTLFWKNFSPELLSYDTIEIEWEKSENIQFWSKKRKKYFYSLPPGMLVILRILRSLPKQKDRTKPRTAKELFQRKKPQGQ